jgi:hypothetical protein
VHELREIRSLFHILRTQKAKESGKPPFNTRTGMREQPYIWDIYGISVAGPLLASRRKCLPLRHSGAAYILLGKRLLLVKCHGRVTK